jgi:sugar/nucleoside kinase (ribokinase family)
VTGVQPDVLVVSRVVLDDLHPREGEATLGVLGGSGFWAAFGAALVSDEVALTCRVGSDFAPYYEALDRLGIRADGLVETGELTSRTVVTYPQGEERHEDPIPDWDAHVAMRTMESEFPAPVRRPRSYYVFRGWHPGFWEGLLPVVRESGAPMLWEIPGAICLPEYSQRIATVLADTAVLSINLEEASSLCGAGGELELIAALHALGAPVVALRRGSRGVIASDGCRVIEAYPPAGSAPVDVTGAGNAFSGAFLAEFRRTSGDVTAAVTAAMAASATAIAQVGPPADLATARGMWRAFRDALEVVPVDSEMTTESRESR